MAHDKEIRALRQRNPCPTPRISVAHAKDIRSPRQGHPWPTPRISVAHAKDIRGLRQVSPALSKLYTRVRRALRIEVISSCPIRTYTFSYPDWTSASADLRSAHGGPRCHVERNIRENIDSKHTDARTKPFFHMGWPPPREVRSASAKCEVRRAKCKIRSARATCKAKLLRRRPITSTALRAEPPNHFMGAALHPPRLARVNL